jgi:acyl carrier protein
MGRSTDKHCSTMADEPIARFILDEFLGGGPVESLPEAQPLISSGLIDSVGTMRLVLFLEETYGLTIDASDISGGHLDSLASLRALVAAKSNR